MSRPDLTPLKSMMFKAYAYDPATSKLRVQYHSGDVWEHDDVPVDKAETFAGSASPGGYFNARIKGLHPGRKL